ncbi:MAG: 16S rRNA processing protein RimM [Calditrichaeota bacterium]|nr:16S rRNA processing protein RimM [Calditrichota bacterium]MCB9366397.1 16S rRNA processing protein RimM [Calditrichota bacterium]
MPELREPDDLVLIGAVVAAHGLQGGVRVEPLTDFPERFLELESCFLRRADGGIERVKLKRCKIAPNGVLLNLEGLKSRNDAELLRGATLLVAKEERVELPDDSFYIGDLIGCSAIDEQGREIGKLADVIRGGQDILSIETGQGELLVPFVREWVGDVHVQNRTIVILNSATLISSEEIPPALGESDD